MYFTYFQATHLPSFMIVYFYWIFLSSPSLFPSFFGGLCETGSHIVQAGLKLTIELRMTSLCLPSAGILGMYHQAHLGCLLSYNFECESFVEYVLCEHFFYTLWAVCSCITMSFNKEEYNFHKSYL